MRRKTRRPVLRRRRALARRQSLGVAFWVGALLSAPMALYELGRGRELAAEVWLVAFVSFLILAWKCEGR